MLESLLEAICWGTVIFVWIIGAIYNYLKVPVIRKGNNSIQMLLPIIIVWAVMEHIPKSYWALITYEANWYKICRCNSFNRVYNFYYMEQDSTR